MKSIASKLKEPTAMVLSTVSAKGVPSSRVVLLQGIELGKFVFYTIYNSDKSLEIMENANVALTFYWTELERQVNIKGSCQKVDVEISEEYFQSRSRKSQLGTWASQQSKELSSRLEMVKEFLTLGIKYMGKKYRGLHTGVVMRSPPNLLNSGKAGLIAFMTGLCMQRRVMANGKLSGCILSISEMTFTDWQPINFRILLPKNYTNWK